MASLGDDWDSLWDGLLNFLKNTNVDPATYLLSIFLFSIAAAVILPIPVETALLVAPHSLPFIVIALAVGLGKGIGAIAVFFIGEKIEAAVLSFGRWGWFKWLLEKSEVFVRRYGYYALFVIMSIPGMPDTIPLYIFSILNKEGKLLDVRWFFLVNVLAGVLRASIILLGIGLFQ